ncbi:MAG: AAA family ATPase [bacterium]|nr:AAA family ATPase [bacterium]
MGPKELGKVLETCVEHREPVLIKGAPGVGKTDVVHQIAKKTKHKLIVFHPVVSDPTDFKGQPAVVTMKNGEKTAEFLPFGDLRALLEADEPTIAFMDDVGQAPAVVQAALMQLILARRVNGHVVSDKVVFMAATNRRQDRAGVTGILEPVKSRFTTILEMVPDKDDWIEWALQHDMPNELIGFINFRPAMLATEEVTSDIINHPSPRTIANAGRLIKMGLMGMEVLGGAVGQGCAVEMIGFIKVFNQLPNIQSILLNPEDAIVPTDPSAQYAVVAALVGATTKDNVGRVFKYAERLPIEFMTLLAKDAVRKDDSITKTRTFIEWCHRHQEIFV